MRRFAATAVATIGLLIAGCTAPAAPSAAIPVTTAATTAATATTSASAPAASSGPTQWLGYHADAARTGDVPAASALDKAKQIWSKSLGAAVYGEPLYFGGTLYVATEKDQVVALNPKTGAQKWHRTVASPLTNVAARAGCGNIDPLGITSTPVIDPGKKVIYVVAESVSKSGAVSHVLFGLRLSDGKVVRQNNVDPPVGKGQRIVSLQQRVGLALANGRVYVGFGGLIGDCGSYHGWVVGVKTSGAADKRSFEVASDGQGGAIWQSGGAPAVDAKGNVYVTTGNANPWPDGAGPDPKKYTEGVVKLSPTLKVLASFKDRSANGDLDLSTGNPVLLPGGLVFAVGKTNIGFLLRQSDLHQVAAIKGVCSSNPDGGPAYYPAQKYLLVPCRAGSIQVVDLGSRRLAKLWPGANSAPIIAGARAWAASYRDGLLYEYDVTSGKVRQRFSIAAGVPNFATPTIAGGRLYLGTKQGIVAFGPR